jgi:hypothetical protein
MGFDPARFEVAGAVMPSVPEYFGMQAAVSGILVNDEGCIGLQGGPDPASFLPIFVGNTAALGEPELQDSGTSLQAFGQQLELGMYLLLGGGELDPEGLTDVGFPETCIHERVFLADSATVLDVQDFVDLIAEFEAMQSAEDSESDS